MQATGTMVSRDTVSAGFVDRLIAVIIDGLILLIPNALVYAVFDGGALGNLVQFLLSAAYAVYFWSSSGQTPGKSVMKLRVVHADGGNVLTPGQALLRYIGTIISAIPLLLGYLWAIWDPKHDTWHDKIASTKVIKVG